MGSDSQSLFERVGGRSTLVRVHKIFYDKVYAHPLLKRYFAKIEQEYIERQQTDFMQSAMGGAKSYSGQGVVHVHGHIYITEALFQVRHVFLRDSMREAGVHIDNAKAWMKIDSAFKRSLVKNKSDCKPRYPKQELMLFADELDLVT